MDGEALRCRLRWLVVHLILVPVSTVGQEGRTVFACGEEQLVVGTALAGTVPVDSGTAFEVMGWTPGSVIRGQRFLVDRAEPPLTKDTVLLVKWQSTPDSRPYRRMDSTLWIEPGQRRFVSGVLRERDHWALGIPTIDVRRNSFPDPEDHRLRDFREQREIMTATEAFDFCSLRVDMGIVEAGDWGREIEPMAWAREHGDSWKKHPARINLYSWAEAIENQRALRATPDVAGTYTARLRLPSGRQLEFFLRTSDQVDWSWTGPTPADDQIPPWEYRRRGYRLDFWIAMKREDLPRAQGGPTDFQCSTTSSLDLPGVTPVPSNPDCLYGGYPWNVGYLREGATRDGLWQPELLEHLFREDEELVALMEQYRSFYRGRRQAGEELPRTGEFLSMEEDELQFHQAIPVAEGLLLTLTLQRISPKAVIEPSRERLVF